MILILSKKDHEYSTDLIEGYLKSYNANFLRINGNDLLTPGALYIDVINNEVILNNKLIRLDEVKVVFNRRWYDRQEIQVTKISGNYSKSCNEEIVESKSGDFQVS